MEFSRQGYWSGLPFPSPGYLPIPWIEPECPALQADSLPSEPPGKPFMFTYMPLSSCLQFSLFCFLSKPLPKSAYTRKKSEKKWSRSVVSNSLRPMDTRLLRPWDFLGKSTGVGCRFLLQGTSRPRDWTQVSHIVDRCFPSEPPLNLSQNAKKQYTSHSTKKKMTRCTVCSSAHQDFPSPLSFRVILECGYNTAISSLYPHP